MMGSLYVGYVWFCHYVLGYFWPYPFFGMYLDPVHVQAWMVFVALGICITLVVLLFGVCVLMCRLRDACLLCLSTRDESSGMAHDP